MSLRLIFEIIGVAWCVITATVALAWVLETALRGLWNRCIDIDDFYHVVCEYAKVRKHKRQNNRVGYSDE